MKKTLCFVYLRILTVETLHIELNVLSGNSRVCLMIASDNTISTTHAGLSPNTKTSQAVYHKCDPVFASSPCQ